ncbi:hypothetical protein ACJJTC_012697 [Scirpophaga incertulas]
MGATKKYFRNQFQIEKLGLEHDEASDFYLSCWQKNRASLPLVCVRFAVFLGCLGIILASLVVTGVNSKIMITHGYWLIYMTHWGVIMITVTSLLAFAVSARAYFTGPIDSTFGLPWYIKLYWVSYTVTLPIAFFITIFYYSLLTALAEEYALDPVLDVFIHGMNSVAMFALLMSAQHPSHLLHFVYPFMFGVFYLIFSAIYYSAGGLSPFGEKWIYPMIDWSKPGPTMIMVVISAIAIIIMHVLVVLLSLLRDFVSKKYVRNVTSMSLVR